MVDNEVSGIEAPPIVMPQGLEYRIGVISDIHHSPVTVARITDEFIKHDVDAILAVGDIGAEHGSHARIPEVRLANGEKLNGRVLGGGNHLKFLEDSIHFILEANAKTGKPFYFGPGSHEMIQPFIKASQRICSQFNNAHSMLTTPKVNLGGVDFVFVPGSDWVAGGQFLLRPGSEGESDIATGLYTTRINPDTEEFEYVFKEHVERLNPDNTFQLRSMQYITNFNDMREHVTDPNNTVVVCHVPPKFDSIEHGIDYAHFAQNYDAEGNETGVSLLQYGAREAAAGLKTQIKKDNRGNVAFRKVLDDLGVRLGLMGHFHESVHRACSFDSEHREQDTYHSDSFVNASHGDNGLYGIVSVKPAQEHALMKHEFYSWNSDERGFKRVE